MPLPFLAWALGALFLGGASLALLAWLDDGDKEDIESFMLENGLNTLHKVFINFCRSGDKILKWLGLKGSPDASVSETYAKPVDDPSQMPPNVREAYERVRQQRTKEAKVDITDHILGALTT